MFVAKDEAGAWRIGGPVGRAGMRGVPAAALQAHGESDAYLWSLADLMTLLLIFFIMLYSSAVHSTPDVGQQTKETVAEMRLDSSGAAPESVSGAILPQAEMVDAQAPQPDPMVATLPVREANPPGAVDNDQMLAQLEGSFNKDFYVRLDERQPVIVLGERITFDVGDAMLLTGAYDALTRVAGLIAGNNDCRVVISGHTDDRPILTSTFPSNWELSAARAASVAKFLASHGVAPWRMVIQGRAEFEPLVANTSEENRKVNRRVEISLIKGQ